MKHIVLSNTFQYGEDPFPAFRADLVYGRNKKDREFLPVKDVKPIIQYVVKEGVYGGKELYSGFDKAEAERVKAEYDERVKKHNESAGVDEPNAEHPELRKYPAKLETVGSPTLPEGKFRVIKTKEKGTILVVPGDDDTNKCLLFVGCAGGFRGGVSVLQDGTTGNVIKTCHAGNRCESSVEVIAILEEGQTVGFHTSGRRTNEVYIYTWDGSKIEKKHYSKSEWDNRNAVVSEVALDDYEIL